MGHGPRCKLGLMCFLSHACGRQAALLTVAVLRPLASAGVAPHLSEQQHLFGPRASAQSSTTVQASGHELLLGADA